jgi:ribokinase
MSGNVALLGDINVDVLLNVPVYPDVGGDAVTEGQQWTVGGSASNTAIALARLGGTPRLAAMVGKDPLAPIAMNALADEGVDLSCVGVDPHAPTGFNVVVVTSDGERTMLASRGANVHLEVDAAALCAETAYLHLSGYALLSPPQSDAAWLALEYASSAGLPVTLDVPTVAVERVPGELRRLLPRLEIIALGEAEACILAGVCDPVEAAAALVAGGAGRVVVKRGPRGSVLYCGSGLASVPGFPVDVLDTTGAGDAFMAGLIHGLAHRLDDEATLVLANTLGALATVRRGAGTQLPTGAEVAEALCTAWPPQFGDAALRALATLPNSTARSMA